MRRVTLALTLVATVSLGALPARGGGPPPSPAPAPSPYIDWQPSVLGAFETAKKEGKPLFLAINAAHVDGKARVEPAGKELREHTYLDAAVVAKSRAFVCVLLRPDGTGAEYDELRARLGIEGLIVSPQHVFVHADGTLIERKEYWSFGAGQASVTALLAMMDSALAAHRAKTEMGTSPASGTPEEQRAAWIRERLLKARAGVAERAARDVAIQELVHGDKQGDCVVPLCALLSEPKRDLDAVVAILRGLGKPGLVAAVAPTAQMLDDSTDAVRGNAAVTLEYIGSAAAIEALTKRLTKEKDELVRNDCCRALGRCGAKQEAVRKTLLRELATAKANRLSAGPAIGLSYFEGDAEAARGIEKVLGPGVDWQRRAFALYALTRIRDPKSADFVREKLLKTEKNQAALPFLGAVVSVLSGTDPAGQSERTVTRSARDRGRHARRHRRRRAEGPRPDAGSCPTASSSPGAAVDAERWNRPSRVQFPSCRRRTSRPRCAGGSSAAASKRSSGTRARRPTRASDATRRTSTSPEWAIPSSPGRSGTRRWCA